MGKTALYSKVDMFDYKDYGDETIAMFDVSSDILYHDKVTDGYTTLARAKLLLLKVTINHGNYSSLSMRSDSEEYNQVKKEALGVVKDKEQLQFWCDLAELDYSVVKKWLLKKDDSFRGYNSIARKRKT